MYQRAFVSSLALIALAALATYWFHIRLRPTDISSFHQLVQQSIELRARQALDEQPALQKRQGVQKDIWSHDETRHLQIQSERSALTLTQKKDKMEAIEELHKVRCTTENGTLTADEGLYSFPSHQFTAQSNCRLAQHDNYVDGTSIHFDLAQEIITYDNPRGYIAPFHFTAHKLIWHKKEGKLYLTDQVAIEQPDHTTIFSDRGNLTLDELQPQLLVLQGNVRLISTRIQDKQSYAVADTLTYHPLEKTILLSAARKVLLWQEGLALSASEVLIRPDQTIEGHGDVHFAFDLEEQSYLDELFKQYL
jgi:lipopolysaccharide export system protein LptA